MYQNQKSNAKQQIEQLRDFILWWDETFPIDFQFRKSHHISFNSKEHRELNLIDLKIELIEDKAIETLIKKRKLTDYRKKQLEKTGVLFDNLYENIREKMTEVDEEEAFNKIDINQFNE